MRATPEERLALVFRSPEAVAAHDRKAWLDLFAADGVVEDPVGTAPARKGVTPGGGSENELAAFYDTFIAPSRVAFRVHRDIVAGSDVVRDVTIETQLASGLEIDVPAYLLYHLVEEEGALRIARMEAHWQLFDLIGQVLRRGTPGLAGVGGMTMGMLRHQGLRGVAGYTRGMTRGIFGRGRAAVAALATAVTGADQAAFLAGFEPGARVLWPGCSEATPSELFAALASLETAEIRSAGWCSSCRFTARREGEREPRQGVAFFGFAAHTKKIQLARLYTWPGPNPEETP